jgi:hypothetical protein
VQPPAQIENNLDVSMKQGKAVKNAHAMDEPGETMIDAGDQMIDALRLITTEQMLHLGARQVVYLKAGMRDGEPAFALYRADGTPFAVVDDVETAVEMADKHGLGFVTIH